VTLTEAQGFQQVKESFLLTVLPAKYYVDPEAKYMNATMDWDELAQIATLNFDQEIKNWHQLVVNDTLLTVSVQGQATDLYHVSWQLKQLSRTGFQFQITFEKPSEIGLFAKKEVIQVAFRNNQTVRGIKDEYMASLFAQVQIDRLLNKNHDYSLYHGIG